MGKILRKRLKVLEERRHGYDINPPKRAKGLGPQQHGTNAKGNIAKRPGSMTK